VIDILPIIIKRLNDNHQVSDMVLEVSLKIIDNVSVQVFGLIY